MVRAPVSYTHLDVYKRQIYYFGKERFLKYGDYNLHWKFLSPEGFQGCNQHSAEACFPASAGKQN